MKQLWIVCVLGYSMLGSSIFFLLQNCQYSTITAKKKKKIKEKGMYIYIWSSWLQMVGLLLKTSGYNERLG